MPVNPVDSVSNLLKGLVALVAVFSGVAALLGIVDIPPTLVTLVRAIAFSVLLVVLIAVFLFRRRISRIPRGKVAIWALVGVCLGATCATGYYRFANQYTAIPIPGGEERYVVPLWPKDDIRRIVDPEGGDYEEALRSSPARMDLRELMQEQSGSTIFLMILLLVISEVLLVAPVVAAGWRLASDLQDDTDPDQQT